ncbi:MAG: hypothetical protein ACK46O_05645 [Flavobacteriia bacterium]
MFKKFTLIFILALALIAFLILRPYIFPKQEMPLVQDRLPDADFIGRAYVLDVARETSGMLYYHKIPFRDLFSQEFILSQGKLYGLNLQNPVYLFANEGGDWGAIVQVSDSSKIMEGIERLRKFIEISDSMYDEQRVYHYPKEKGYLTYSNNYMLLYKGEKFDSIFNRVTKAKRGDLTTTWKSFLRERQFKDDKLVLFSNWNKLKENGIETAIFAHDSDSISFSLKAYIRNKKPLNISMKKEGLNLKNGEFTSKMVNLHLDVTKLRNDPEDPLYKLLVKLGKKVGFPTKDFMNTWEGDLSFRQGGYQIVKETYIESVLDDDFNVTEVEMEKEVKVPGFTIMFSVNKSGPQLIRRLLSKGIITQNEDKYRVLFSPELCLTKKENYFIFHTGQYAPKTINDGNNSATWTQQGTKLEFSLDSISKYEVFGSIYIPVDRIIRRNRFF